MRFRVLFASLILAAGLAGVLVFGPSSAQERTMIRSVAHTDDRKLAEVIERLTDRSTDELIETRLPNGSIQLDLAGRFQHVPVAVLDEKARPVVGCVAALDEANRFFGRNLKTGETYEPRPSPLDAEEEHAALNGISVDEYAFYVQLIKEGARKRTERPNAATITILNIDNLPNEGLNDPTPTTPVGGNNGTTLGEQRLNVLNLAAGIWGSFLDTTVRIRVRSQFIPQPCGPFGGALGSGGTFTIHRDFEGALLPGTWYPAALASKQTGSDINPFEADIGISLSSSLNGNPNCLGGATFYLGFDNASPPQTRNLLLLVLHEMGHGLGFSEFTDGSTGTLNSGFPDVYTTYMYDREAAKGWNEMDDAGRRASAVNGPDLLWDGPNVRIGSAGLTDGREASTGRVQLYAPAQFSDGSSLSHFDSACVPNLLMEPFFTSGIPLTLDLTRQQMRDIGWYRDTNADGSPDAIKGVAPSGTSISAGSKVSATWINDGGFDQNVAIDLSTDGGATFPISIATDIPNTGSFEFVVPDIPTTSGRIRVRETSFASPSGISSADLTIAAIGTLSIEGRVLSPSGIGQRNAVVALIDQTNDRREFTTGSFGVYSFTGLVPGQTYTITVRMKRFRFSPQVITLTSSLSNFDLVGLE